MTFVDPKGIRKIGSNVPKSQSFQTIKDIERHLGEPSVALSSFIVSNTPSYVTRPLWAVDKPPMEAPNILFKEEDKTTCVGNMIQRLSEMKAPQSI